MLERAVQLEPQFAPAWEAMGLRYYDHGTYGAGGEAARQRSLAALRRALELDPESIVSARTLVAYRAEAGDLEGAYQQARQMLDHFGPRAQAHFALAYVYRFGGLFEAAQRHCELALDRDPHDPRLRSCAYSYLYAGELSRVMDFLLLDEGSYFVQWGTVLYSLRTNDRDTALRAARKADDDPTRRLMEPCLEGVRGSALDEPVAGFIAYYDQIKDGETPYAVSPMLVYCGRPQDALRFVERAVDSNFCAYPALDLDPIWAALRNDREFQRIRGKAMACHERFRRMVDAYDARRHLTVEAPAGLRHERRHLLLIAPIRLADVLREIALLEAHGEEDVAAHARRKQEMTGGHGRRAPEDQQPAEVNRMAHDLVEIRRDECGLTQFSAAQRVPALLQTEQLEMVDQKRRPQQHEDAEDHDRPAEHDAPRRIRVPQNRCRNRSPLPHEQREDGARDQHVSAALQLLRHGPVPQRLNPGRAIAECCSRTAGSGRRLPAPRLRRAHVASQIDGLRHEWSHLHIAEEGEQVQEDQQEHAVAKDAEENTALR